MESADKRSAATTPPSLELSIRQPIAPSVQQDSTQRLMPPPPAPDQPARLSYHGRSAHRQHRTLRLVAAKPYWQYNTSENDARVANYMERQLKDQNGHMIQTSLTLASSQLIYCQQAAAEFDRIKRAQRFAIKRQKDLQMLEEAAKRQKQLQLLEEACQQQGLILAMEDSHMHDVINASFQQEYASKPAQITSAWSYKCAQAAAQRAAHELSHRQSQPLRPSHHHQPHQPHQPAHHNQNAFATPAPVSDPGSNRTNRVLPVLNRGATFGDKMRPPSQLSESSVISDGDTETAPRMTIFYASMVNVYNDVPYELNGLVGGKKSPLKKAWCCPPANRVQVPDTPGHLFSELAPVLPQPRPGPTFPHLPPPPSCGVNNNMHAPPYPSTQLMLPVESTTVVTTTTTSPPPPPLMQPSSEAQPSHPLRRGSGMGFSYSARQPTVASTGLELPQARKASLARFLLNRKLTQSSKEKKRGLGGVREEGEDGFHSHERTESRPVEPTNATVLTTVHSPARGTLSPVLLPQPGGPGARKPASPTRPPPTPPRQYFLQEKFPGSTSKRTLEHAGGEDNNLSKQTQSGEALIKDEAPKSTDFVMDVVEEVLKEFPPSSSG